MKSKEIATIIWFVLATGSIAIAQCENGVCDATGITGISVTAEAPTSTSACQTCCSGNALVGGPGTEMTKMINRIGLGSDCSRCKSLAAQMDRGGPQWVRQNFNYVVSRTISNAQALGHQMGPVRRAGVRMLVRRAIRRG